MKPPVKAFWDKVKIKPEKWQLSPWGDEGGGFWIVCLIGQRCIYYNDIEDGFDESVFEQLDIIRVYGCNQSDLLSFISPLIGTRARLLFGS